MTHEEFIAAYREGRVSVGVDPDRAAKLVSARMLLPLFLLPLLGLAVALAIVGHWIIGGLVFAATLVFRYAVRASARGFVLTRALHDPEFFAQAVRDGVLSISILPQ